MKPQAPTARARRSQQRRASPARALAKEAKDGAVSSPPIAHAASACDPRVPSSYPRRILLAVTGLSPQVVTETLYYLATRQQPPFVPTEVHLITTRQGADNAHLNLLSEKIRWFHRLREDYKLPEIALDSGHIHVIRARDGSELEDIRSPADNECAADFITEVVRELVSDPQSALHVSIAGGRKTMGYYLGYALSLLGRAQDRLSHVLVSAPYENNRDFYYPTRYECPIHVQQNGKDVAYDCRKAVVDLADIPFVRLRDDSLSQDLRDGKKTFSQAVVDAQRALPPISLVLHPSNCSAIAGGERIEFRPAEFAFYWLLAERCRSGRAGVHWTDAGFNTDLLDLYARISNPWSGTFANVEKAIGKNYTKENFDPAKKHINNRITAALGKRHATPYLVTRLECIPRTRYSRFGLNIPASAIHIDVDTPDAARPSSKRKA